MSDKVNYEDQWYLLDEELREVVFKAISSRLNGVESASTILRNFYYEDDEQALAANKEIELLKIARDVFQP